VLLLLLSLFLGLLALFLAMSWDLILEVDTDAPANVNVSLPEVHWIFYALPAIIFLIAFCVLLKRLIIAWRGRKGPASV
jgi:TRAP-type C4-dicarboxylate transport system permease small subunit